MKTLKFLFMFAIALCLIGSVSAVVVYGDWEDSSQSAVIYEGESIDFNVDFYSINPPMSVNINLYDSNSKLIHSFENNLVVSGGSHFETYTLSRSIYSRPGNYELVLVGSDSKNTDSHILNLIIREVSYEDNPPRITLLGDPEVNVIQYWDYNDAGATAWDKEDGDLTDDIIVTGSVNTKIVGTYVLTYSVEDSAGNKASVKRTVNVLPSGIDEDPVITLLGKSSITICKCSDYTDAGATAYDKEDGDITHRIKVDNPVDTNKIGTYTITYNVKDTAGNDADEVTRTVKVISCVTENTAPVIELLGSSFVKVKLGTYYYDKGATAWDKEDGDLTDEIVVSNPVNVNRVGTYTITYNVKDSKGKSATEVTRTVKVYKSCEDTFTMNVIVPKEDKEYSTNKLTFKVETNKKAYVKFSLDNDPKVKMNYVGTYDGISVYKYKVYLSEGEHEVTFYATDNYGNRVSETIEFSIDFDDNDDNDYKYRGTDSYYSDAYTDYLYYEQFQNKNIIIMEDDYQPEKKLNWWQRFIEWLKRIFGFT